MFAVKTLNRQSHNSVSDNYDECEQYTQTSTVETDTGSSDLNGEDGGTVRHKRKRMKKVLPEDFISSQDLDGSRKCVRVFPREWVRLAKTRHTASLSHSFRPLIFFLMLSELLSVRSCHPQSL